VLAVRPDGFVRARRNSLQLLKRIENPLVKAARSCNVLSDGATNRRRIYAQPYTRLLIEQRIQKKVAANHDILVGRVGIEPATLGLKVPLNKLKRVARD
jgi:hypothetical protein